MQTLLRMRTQRVSSSSVASSDTVMSDADADRESAVLTTGLPLKRKFHYTRTKPMQKRNCLIGDAVDMHAVWYSRFAPGTVEQREHRVPQGTRQELPRPDRRHARHAGQHAGPVVDGPQEPACALHARGAGQWRGDRDPALDDRPSADPGDGTTGAGSVRHAGRDRSQHPSPGSQEALPPSRTSQHRLPVRRDPHHRHPGICAPGRVLPPDECLLRPRQHGRRRPPARP